MCTDHDDYEHRTRREFQRFCQPGDRLALIRVIQTQPGQCGTCELCGRGQIGQQFLVRNESRNTFITVGNICVHQLMTMAEAAGVRFASHPPVNGRHS